MKPLKLGGLMTLVVSLALVFWSCGGNSSASHDHHEKDATHSEMKAKEGKEYTSAYVCPMHCEGSGSDKAGKCPACGMDYVAQAEHTKDGHEHE